jgi:hypothetical protein
MGMTDAENQINERIRRTIPCVYRERLLKYVAQTVRDLIAAQEQPGTSPTVGRFGADLIAAANAWKRARLSYEQHVKEHGCAGFSDHAVAATNGAVS